jgi:FkbM family methyltransferase
MLRSFRIIASDFAGLWRVCGPLVALRWLWAICTHFGRCRRSGNLQPADAALGSGPFRVCLRNSSAILSGNQVLTGIREIWVRDPYLGNFLAIPKNATVVDLGANMGVFTALALGHGPGVKVLSIEADPNECARLRATLAANDPDSRATIVNAFVGGMASFQSDLKSTGRASAIPTITEEDILARIGGGPVHFLKCDIEGSEFALLASPGPLFAATLQFAAELHPDSGDVDAAIAQLKDLGFEVLRHDHPPTTLIQARRLTPIQS